MAAIQASPSTWVKNGDERREREKNRGLQFLPDTHIRSGLVGKGRGPKKGEAKMIQLRNTRDLFINLDRIEMLWK